MAKLESIEREFQQAFGRKPTSDEIPGLVKYAGEKQYPPKLGKQVKLGERQLGFEKFKTGYNVTKETAGWLKWLLIFMFTAYVIIGPGLIGILTLIKQVPWPILVVIIFVGILLWRQR